MITTTLTINGVSGDTSATSNRGNISLTLRSPSGTFSTILPYRINDNVVVDPYASPPAAYLNWSFKSLHFWGEDPTGTWTLTVLYEGVTGSVAVSNTAAVFYGTSQTPPSVASIPLVCDQACARGCSGMGPSNCDVCGAGYYRDVTTLACTQSCTSGTAQNGYCYNPSDPDPVCTRSAISAAQLMAASLIVVLVSLFEMIL